MPSFTDNYIAQFVCVCGFETQHRTSQDGRSLEALKRLHMKVCPAFKGGKVSIKKADTQKLSVRAEGGKGKSYTGSDQAIVHKELIQSRDVLDEKMKKEYKKFYATCGHPPY